MTKNVVLLGDKTLSLLARDLNSQLKQVGSDWHAIDAGYDSWLVAPLDQSCDLFDKNTAAWGFVLSPRVLENVPDIATELQATLERLASLEAPPTVLFSNFFRDPRGGMPISNNLEKHSLANKLNEQLLTFRESHSWFHVVDHLGLALQHGVGALNDQRFEAIAQVYFSPAGNRQLSRLWFRSLRSLERPQKKVCVIDLDNTLWGGILGEDGPDALQMTDSGSGLVHRQFQRTLLELRRSGILLAICSKNNPAEAMETLRSHPDCLLRPTDFAHMEIGWGLKSEAIVRTAEKLSLGLDSFVFIDDSPVEREEVAHALPSVEVLDFPSDSTGLVNALNEYSGFDSLRQTDEDRKRADAYVHEAQRSVIKATSKSPEEFYRSLKLQLGIFSARVEQAGRLHQLLMKTNQFNLTARRISDESFRALLGNGAYMVLGMRVSDRFGDSGITGLAIVDRNRHDAWMVQDFLLSCRVLGRTVENAFFSWLIARAASAGAYTVAIQYVATARNQVPHGFLKESGGTESAAGDTWTFDVRRPEIIPAHYVEIDDSLVS
ncbi:MAG TPA: HAD-IIIC family phosphatase [Rhizomicrobium sp.]|jgi:FkbH-like protein|nr:HAD-IIIC family phosphatase [Rhizomicrobium sp.]